MGKIVRDLRACRIEDKPFSEGMPEKMGENIGIYKRIIYPSRTERGLDSELRAGTSEKKELLRKPIGLFL